MLYVADIVQLRNDTEGRAYYRRGLQRSKTSMEARRSLRRRLSDGSIGSESPTQRASKQAQESTPGRLQNPARPT